MLESKKKLREAAWKAECENTLGEKITEFQRSVDSVNVPEERKKEGCERAVDLVIDFN